MTLLSLNLTPSSSSRLLWYTARAPAVIMGGWAVAEQVGDSEHEERDGEEHDGPNYDE